MWPFDLFDDSPEWVKARRKRFKLIENFVIDNIPDILLMPDSYSFMHKEPMLIDGDSSYFLGIKRFAGVGDACGICLGYYKITEYPIEIRNEYEYKTYMDKDFEYFFQGNELEIWKQKLSEQLPEFFECCQKDITQQLHNIDNNRIITKQRCDKSVDKTSSIINCLESRMRNSYDH